MAFKIEEARWVVEAGNQHKELVEALERGGVEYTLVKPYAYCMDGFEHPYTNEPSIHHGSIGFVSSMRKYGDIFFDFEKLRCKTYYKRFKKYMLTDEYEFIDPKELLDKKEYLYDKYGVADTIFIKPDTNDKVFSGTLIELENFEKDAETTLSYLKNYGLYCPLVICKPWKISHEWRFFVRSGEVITGSRYKLNNKVGYVRDWPLEAEAVALDIANEFWAPAPMFCADICLSGDEYRLLEIGAWNCSGYYAADLDKIVEAANQEMYW